MEEDVEPGSSSLSLFEYRSVQRLHESDYTQAIDTYCTQAGARQDNITAAHAVHCQQCGSVNDEGARFSQMCSVPLTIQNQHEQQGG